jgi:membrane-anchored glycerophosphoryl diester phosphodiesterase (GDPDase)
LLLLPFIFALYIAAVAVMLRLCPLLPARAVGDLDLTFKQTWRRTRGNTWRLLWGITACTVPLGLIAQIVMLSVVGFPGPNMFAGDAFVGRMAAISVIFAIYYLLFLPVMIGFMSISYRHFFPRA